jgi:hypothetical protein
MTKTKYYNLQMDDPQDDYDVDVVNANLKKIDEQMKTRENATDALQEPEFTVAAKRENIASKEKMPKILGKIAKFFADLKTVAFSGKYNDLDGKPAIVNNNTTTEPGSALDARQANPNIEGTMAASIAQINSNLMNNLFYGQRVSSIKDIDSVGLYYITNSSEMPSGDPFVLYSFGIVGRSWNYPIFAFNAYSNYMLYVGRNATNDGVNYSFSGWNQIQTQIN